MSSIHYRLISFWVEILVIRFSRLKLYTNLRLHITWRSAAETGIVDLVIGIGEVACTAA